MADDTHTSITLSDETLRVAVAKLIAETGHIRMQTTLAPFLVGAGMTVAIAAVVVAVLKIFFN